jgi:Cd2+/Zn2+-exporting ATPase
MAIANADVVLMNDDPYKMITAMDVAHKTEVRARVNIFIALLVKLAVMITSLAWSGFPLWCRRVADTGLTVLLVLQFFDSQLFQS